MNLQTVGEANAAPEPAKEIHTKAIHLVGEGNAVRASLFLDSDNSPRLVMLDSKGTNRIEMGLDPAGTPILTFNYKNSRKMVGIDAQYDSPRILIADKNGKILWKATKEEKYQNLR